MKKNFPTRSKKEASGTRPPPVDIILLASWLQRCGGTTMLKIGALQKKEMDNWFGPINGMFFHFACTDFLFETQNSHFGQYEPYSPSSKELHC